MELLGTQGQGGKKDLVKGTEKEQLGRQEENLVSVPDVGGESSGQFQIRWP